jgi:hypothetical protein
MNMENIQNTKAAATIRRVVTVTAESSLRTVFPIEASNPQRALAAKIAACPLIFLSFGISFAFFDKFLTKVTIKSEE